MLNNKIIKTSSVKIHTQNMWYLSTTQTMTKNRINKYRDTTVI